MICGLGNPRNCLVCTGRVLAAQRGSALGTAATVSPAGASRTASAASALALFATHQAGFESITTCRQKHERGWRSRRCSRPLRRGRDPSLAAPEVGGAQAGTGGSRGGRGARRDERLRRLSCRPRQPLSPHLPGARGTTTPSQAMHIHCSSRGCSAP